MISLYDGLRLQRDPKLVMRERAKMVPVDVVKDLSNVFVVILPAKPKRTSRCEWGWR